MPKIKRKSTTSFGGLGLTKEEDEKLIKRLKKDDLKLKQLCRKLILDYLKT